MGYSKVDFDRDMGEAFENAWNAAQRSLEDVQPNLMATYMLPYYVGDKPLKRQLQTLLDKFSGLNNVEMYRGDDIDNPEGELCMYRKKPKFLLNMMDMKIKKIAHNSSKNELGAFADGRTKKSTISFIENVQLLIDLM